MKLTSASSSAPDSPRRPTREGLALGLDQDDEIVRRRMAQKMQFLAEDAAAQHAPTDAELRAWFDQNKNLFEDPLRLGFRHLYFSPDRRASNARADSGGE
jgi:hypothetical protein